MIFDRKYFFKYKIFWIIFVFWLNVNTTWCLFYNFKKIGIWFDGADRYQLIFISERGIQWVKTALIFQTQNQFTVAPIFIYFIQIFHGFPFANWIRSNPKLVKPRNYLVRQEDNILPSAIQNGYKPVVYECIETYTAVCMDWPR